MNDSNLQQMLLQTEVTPPEMAWEKIAVDLDELEADKPLQQQILQLEEEVPASAWNNLEVGLDDLALQKKLESIEETVPASAWEQIELALNIEQNDKAVASALQALEVVPPTSAWHNIESSLEQQSAKVIPIKQTPSRIYRLAAAAAITGLLAWGGYSLLNRSTEEQTVAVASNEATTPPTAIAPSAPVQTDSIEPDEQKKVSTSRNEIKERIKQNLKLNDAVAYVETPDHSLQNNVPYQGIHHQKQLVQESSNGFSESQYYMVLNENGELVRVSKKITDLKCVAGNTAVDAANDLQLKECNEQIKRWREKMAMAAVLSASAGDIDLNQLANSTDQQ